MVREIGTAFAVLAIYLLTILAPLHQARASQLAFQELGYSTLETGWVLCTPFESSGENPRLTVSKCPAAGIGKHEAIAPSLATILLQLDRTALAAPRLVPPLLARPNTVSNPFGPRGPPVQA